MNVKKRVFVFMMTPINKPKWEREVRKAIKRQSRKLLKEFIDEVQEAQVIDESDYSINQNKWQRLCQRFLNENN